MFRAISFVLAAAVLAASPAAYAHEGAELFQKKCAACHGKDGSGNERMGTKDLKSTKLSAAEAEKVIADGRAKMPAYKGKLADDQIKELAAHVTGGLK
ncbi:MAG TPA: cytochrome c [Anaeromyxobacteraceae bacterium]|jgi:mono/diheme cytochrome c family protein|nr:cytochrome c [Anaeromyxobacteraceae bacterium]